MTEFSSNNGMLAETRSMVRVIPSSSVLSRMAVALRSAFSLPEAEELARLLAVEEGLDVEAILICWISASLLEIDDARAAQLLPMLVGRLDQLLESRNTA